MVKKEPVLVGLLEAFLVSLIAVGAYYSGRYVERNNQTFQCVIVKEEKTSWYF